MNLSFEVRPDLRELLGEIGKQEESALLGFSRAEKRNLARGHLPEPLGARAPFLSKAERHLLDVHREEYAELLTVMARRAHLGLGWEIYPICGLRVEHEAKAQEDIANRVRSASKVLPAHPDGPETSGTVDPESLLEAAVRIRPTETRFMGLAFGYMGRGQHRAARVMIARVLGTGVGARASGIAWSVLGASAAQKRNFSDAFEFYSIASTANPEGLVEAANALFFGLEVADEQAWQTCVVRMNAVPPDGPTVESVASFQQEGIRSGKWRPTSRAVDRARAAINTANLQTRRLLSAVVAS